VKILKQDSLTHKQLEALEQFLYDNNITINGIEYITVTHRNFTIRDVDADTQYASLPRTYDTQKFVLCEN
jgi:hypothetical protein